MVNALDFCGNIGRIKRTGHNRAILRQHANQLSQSISSFLFGRTRGIDYALGVVLRRSERIVAETIEQDQSVFLEQRADLLVRISAL